MEKSEKKENTSKHLNKIGCSAGAFTAIVFASYFFNFYFNILSDEIFSDKPQHWSAFGEYIGGILSPILAFLALIALLHSIRLQTAELSHSTEQLKKSAEALDNQNKLIQKQNLETTIFQMLKLYDEIVQKIAVSVQINGIPTTKEGREAITHIYTMFKANHFDQSKTDTSNPEKSKIDKYAEFYKNYRGQIGHYYRVIYNILKFIGHSDLAYEEQKFYADILRAQLSRHELVLFFYNVFYFEGNGKGKMYQWVMQYNILKHIEKEELSCSDYPKLDQVFQAYKAHRQLMKIQASFSYEGKSR